MYLSRQTSTPCLDSDTRSLAPARGTLRGALRARARAHTHTHRTRLPPLRRVRIHPRGVHAYIGEACAHAHVRGCTCTRPKSVPVYTKQTKQADALCLGKRTSLNITRLNSADATALYTAALAGHHQVVCDLIAAGCDTDSAAQNGATPLYAAAEQGHEAVIRALIDAGCDVDKTNNVTANNATPLWAAANFGRADVVRLLLASGCDKEKVAEGGTSPLWIASGQGHARVIGELIVAGCDLDKVVATFFVCFVLCTDKSTHTLFLLKKGCVHRRCSHQHTHTHTHTHTHRPRMGVQLRFL